MNNCMTSIADNPSPYLELGCANRLEYFQLLADQHGCSVELVAATASLLGMNEDFDGLPAMLEDLSLHGDIEL